MPNTTKTTNVERMTLRQDYNLYNDNPKIHLERVVIKRPWWMNVLRLKYTVTVQVSAEVQEVVDND